MPKVTKQTTSVEVQSSSSILDRIQPVQTSANGIKLLGYGRGKTGKTRLLCSFRKPVLVIGSEDGTASVGNIPGVDFVRIGSSQDFSELTDLLRERGKSFWSPGKKAGEWIKLEKREGAPYISAGTDTAGGFQDILLKEVTGMNEIPVNRTWGMAAREQWMAVGAQFKEYYNKLLQLSESIKLDIMVIAHERNFNEDANTSDVMVPHIGAALTPQAANWLNGACDYICQTFLRLQTIEEKVMVGKEEQINKIQTGKVEYCLRVGPHPNFMTGFRLPEGFKLPGDGVIVDPTFDKIKNIIIGKGGK